MKAEAPFRWARIGAMMASNDPYVAMFREALEHTGLRVEWLEECTAEWLETVDVLLLCGHGHLTDSQRDAVHNWTQDGGALVACGGTWGLHDLLGIARVGTVMPKGVVKPKGNDRLWPTEALPARFFGGTLVKAENCEVAATCGSHAAVTRRRAHRGAAFYVGPHVGQTLQLMLMGRSVESDAIGPDDGSALLSDGKLRAEDGTNLDYDTDRTRIEGQHAFFGTAHADIVREIWVRAILQAAEYVGVSVPLFWHLPKHTGAMAMLTMECEVFNTDRVFQVCRTLAMFGCAAAWLVRTPGYSLDAFRALRAREHEIGLLFETNDHSGWHEERLKIQLTAMRRAAARPQMLTFRPIEGKWRGYTLPYELAEAAGARVSVSRGGRQTGTMGFPFGTCHPYFPVRRDGSSFYVMEIPTAMANPGQDTPEPISDALIEQTRQRNGCLGIVATPDAFDEQREFLALRRLLSLCKQARLEFIMPEQLFKYERARRTLRINQTQADGHGSLFLSSETGVEDLSLLVSGPAAIASVRGREIQSAPIERYGTVFQAMTLRLEPKQQVEVFWDVEQRKTA